MFTLKSALEAITMKAVASAACALLLITTAFAVADERTPRAFDISPQSLATALSEFARQSQQEILFAPAIVADKTTDGLRGTYPPLDALKQILGDTGLTFSTTPSGAILVQTSEQGADTSPTPSAPQALAQNDSSSQTNSPYSREQNPARDSDKNSESRVIDEIVVTGSHIRGAAPAGQHLLTIDREQIERSGYATVQDVLRALPQNFVGGATGASEDGAVGPGGLAATNNEAATGANLRGFGTTATLTLLNGHRMAPSAFGGIVDISIIPLAAVDHVDVLTDGASAVYGADAVGGVVNFVLRKDYEGAETHLRYGTVTDGELAEEILGQTFGGNWASGGVLAGIQYTHRSELESTDRSFTADAPAPTDIFPDVTRYSGIVSANQRILPNLDVFADGLFARSDVLRRINSVFSLSNSENRNNALNIHAGLGYEPFADWRIELSATRSRQEFEKRYLSISPPLGGYTPGALALDNSARVSSLDVSGDGSLFTVASGAVRAAIGASYRTEDFTSFVPYASLRRNVERHLNSEFVEVHVPVVGPQNATSFARRLDISIAARRDDYSDFGSTTNPRYGVSWSPVDGVDLRASKGKSFRAPTSNELLGQDLGLVLFNFLFTSPAGGPDVPVFVLSGIDPDLGPEKADTWTLGFDLRAPLLGGAELSVTYYEADYRDRIIAGPFNPGVLVQPEVYGSLIIPIANDAAAAAYLADSLARGVAFQDFFGFGSTGVRYVYNQSTINAATVRQTGFDVVASYPFDIGGSHFDARVNLAIIDEITTAFTAGSVPVDLVSTYSNPPKFRSRLDLSWARGAWRASSALSYVGSYDDTSASPLGRADSWLTADLNLRFAMASAEGLLGGASVGLSVINLFDTDPPFVQGIGLSGVHYDVGNADPRGRFVSIDFRKSW